MFEYLTDQSIKIGDKIVEFPHDLTIFCFKYQFFYTFYLIIFHFFSSFSPFSKCSFEEAQLIYDHYILTNELNTNVQLIRSKQCLPVIEYLIVIVFF